MHVGIREKDKDVLTILKILNVNVGKKVRLDEILIQLLIKNISSSDLLFMILQKLRRDGYLEGKKGVLFVVKKIENHEIKKIVKEIKNELMKNKKIFITPLEVSKFYQCPRRLWLEKIVLSKQYKEKKGKVWDGEALHLAVSLLVKSMIKGENKVNEIVENVIKKYKNKTTLGKEKLFDFLNKFYSFIVNEEPFKLFPEKTIESFKIGLVGTPDIIVINKKNEVFPIDIKLGKVGKNIKQEHLLQIVGESILIENFFRKKVEKCYLVYFESDSLVKINIDEELKKNFLKFKKYSGKVLKSRYIPEISKLPNYKKRVCLGCHVKHACENIENLKRAIY